MSFAHVCVTRGEYLCQVERIKSPALCLLEGHDLSCILEHDSRAHTERTIYLDIQSPRWEIAFSDCIEQVTDSVVRVLHSARGFRLLHGKHLRLNSYRRSNAIGLLSRKIANALVRLRVKTTLNNTWYHLVARIPCTLK
jgi:hypothetical protein